MNFLVLIKTGLLIGFVISNSMARNSDDHPGKTEDNQLFQVDSIVYQIGDAFDDANRLGENINNDNLVLKTEQFFYKLGNLLHIKTRPSCINKLILFKQGDMVSDKDLRDSERLLRTQNFINAASVTRKTTPNGKNIIHIKTADIFSTIPMLSIPRFSFSMDDIDLNYGIGLSEYNIMGYGQELKGGYSHTINRDYMYVTYINPYFLIPHNRMTLWYSNESDGSQILLRFEKPYLTLLDRWKYFILYNNREYTKWLFDSGNNMPQWSRVDSTEDSETFFPRYANLSGYYERVREDSLILSAATSFGHKLVHSWGAGFRYIERQHNPDDTHLPVFKTDDGVYNTLDSSVFMGLEEYKYYLVSVGVTLKWYDYIKMQNYNRVKWQEDLFQGFKINTSVHKDIQSKGKQAGDWLVEHLITIATGVHKTAYFKLNCYSHYYYSNSLDKIYRGESKNTLDAFIREGDYFSTRIKGNVIFLFRQSSTEQLQMGGALGFAAVPDFYFTGQAKYLLDIEQRYVLPGRFETMTLAPVLAVYCQAGQVYSHISHTDFSELNYAAGFGLRTVKTKSAFGSATHLNIGWPLNGKAARGIKGFRVEVVAKLTL
ncbi:MAG: hypothetical protein HQK83_01560 [Fibrobacteria bacterium]|nr:hypothetical protein [Fibrobacteria bacterium]